MDVDRPVGAFYLFPDFSPHAEALHSRGIRGSRALCERLLEETGVAILPGVEFGRPAGELTARLAYVDFNGARALAAVEVLPKDQSLGEAFLRDHCACVLDAIDRIRVSDVTDKLDRLAAGDRSTGEYAS